MKYAVVLEWAPGTEGAPGNWCAHVPDLQGCVAAADTLEETRALVAEAIQFHIEGLRLRRQPVPEPTTVIDTVDVQAA